VKPRTRRKRAELRRRSRITRGMARRRRAGLWDDPTPIIRPITGYEAYLMYRCISEATR
jgi:hypothetical protein